MAKTLDQLLDEGRFTSTMKRALKNLFNFTKPYKVYTALLTQSGTNAPVATVLENTIGNIIWSYEGAGIYKASNININPNNTFAFAIANYHQEGIADIPTVLNGELYLRSNLNGVLEDDNLNKTPIEIRVYN